MEIQQVSSSSAEAVYINVKNVDASTISAGYAACFMGPLAADVASADGIQVVLSGASRVSSFAGIAAINIAVNAIGRVQNWGFLSGILLSQETDKTIGPVGGLVVGGLAGAMISSTLQAVSTALYRYVQPMNTTNISGALPYGKGFIRAI